VPLFKVEAGAFELALLQQQKDLTEGTPPRKPVVQTKAAGGNIAAANGSCLFNAAAAHECEVAAKAVFGRKPGRTQQGQKLGFVSGK